MKCAADPSVLAHFAGRYVLTRTGSAQVLSIACRMQRYHLLACAIETYSMQLAQIKREAYTIELALVPGCVQRNLQHTVELPFGTSKEPCPCSLLRATQACDSSDLFTKLEARGCRAEWADYTPASDKIENRALSLNVTIYFTQNWICFI